FHGRYPPNVDRPSPGDHWYDDGRAPAYLSGASANSAPSTGGVLACPVDDGAGRSYAMNYRASSKVDDPPVANPGEFFMANVQDSSRMILVIECWSTL